MESPDVLLEELDDEVLESLELAVLDFDESLDSLLLLPSLELEELSELEPFVLAELLPDP